MRLLNMWWAHLLQIRIERRQLERITSVPHLRVRIFLTYEIPNTWESFQPALLSDVFLSALLGHPVRSRSLIESESVPLPSLVSPDSSDLACPSVSFGLRVVSTRCPRRSRNSVFTPETLAHHGCDQTKRETRSVFSKGLEEPAFQ